MNLRLQVLIKSKWITYLRENWGTPFIIAFMLLLMRAAAHLVYGLVQIANEIAIYAYYSLVIGVVLQLMSYIKYGPSNKEDNKAGSSS